MRNLRQWQVDNPRRVILNALIGMRRFEKRRYLRKSRFRDETFSTPEQPYEMASLLPFISSVVRGTVATYACWVSARFGDNPLRATCSLFG